MNKCNNVTHRYYLGAGKNTSSPIDVTLIGVGGNGSNVLTALARMHYVLVKLGHPGLAVTAYDGDQITPSNCGRQLFSPAELGLNKALCMMTRVNNFFSLHWRGYAHNFDESVWEDYHYTWGECYQIVISCVDSAKARLVVERSLKRRKHGIFLWLDIGNTKSTGQGIIGSIGYRQQPQPPADNIATVERLPTVIDLYPDISEHDSGEEAAPSCSVEEALTRQDLFINKSISTMSMKILFDGIRQGYFDIHGLFLNLVNMQMSPLKVSPDTWQAMGYSYSREQSALKFITFLNDNGISAAKVLDMLKSSSSKSDIMKGFDKLFEKNSSGSLDKAQDPSNDTVGESQ